MDLVLNWADYHFLTPYVYPASWREEGLLRQLTSLYCITMVGAYILYFIATTFSYFFIFDKRLMNHPQILPNQIRREIMYTMKSAPFMAFPTVALFIIEVRGYSKLYDNVDTTKGYFGVVFSMVTFILFTDACIYWIHRVLHHKSIYKHVHKAHHKWVMPTPFASHAFHPIDGFLQSCPYHIYPFLFPLHKLTYLGLFVFVNFWTVSIHDGDYRVPDTLKPIVNGSAHHTDHHLFFNYNYGQFFTLWDRIGGSFRNPSAFEGNGPLQAVEECQKVTHAKGQKVKHDIASKND